MRKSTSTHGAPWTTSKTVARRPNRRPDPGDRSSPTPNFEPASPIADRYWTIETVLGRAYVAYNERGIAALAHAPNPDAFERQFLTTFGRPIQPIAAPPIELGNAVTASLRGELTAEAAREVLAFDLRGRGAFERAVLLKTAEIPYGEVRPYAWIAREIGHPKAVRAVGSAIGRNPIALLIPCHRVIRRDGRIGDYGSSGVAVKRALLAAEGVDPQWLEDLAQHDVRYVGDVASQRYCFPSCRIGRWISDDRRITFGSDDDAIALGFHPCTVCRPARPTESD